MWLMANNMELITKHAPKDPRMHIRLFQHHCDTVLVPWHCVTNSTIKTMHHTAYSIRRISFYKDDKDKDKDLFIGPQELVVGYSKAPEQPQSSARPICYSHAMARTGREPATIRIAAYRSSPCYALRHRRRRNMGEQSSEAGGDFGKTVPLGVQIFVCVFFLVFVYLMHVRNNLCIFW